MLCRPFRRGRSQGPLRHRHHRVRMGQEAHDRTHRGHHPQPKRPACCRRGAGYAHSPRPSAKPAALGDGSRCDAKRGTHLPGHRG